MLKDTFTEAVPDDIVDCNEVSPVDYFWELVNMMELRDISRMLQTCSITSDDNFDSI